jgi:nitroimidazol reductase NimA-like FMN-containing flavoprotein (pyridoxamine 5'-phosphate oxidase superfamily)
MTIADREKFLADVHVGVLSVADEPGRAPVTVPVWYRYEPGGQVVLVTGRDSRKARLIRAAGRFSLCAQQETPPYRYVSVSGPAAVLEDGGDPREHQVLADRYLPPREARAYMSGATHDLTQTVTIRMEPQHWFSADFSSDLG